MDNTKYGLMTYQTRLKLYNAGDYIQSLAAKQYLPQVDAYINREALSDYTGDPVKMIMNGWYMHHPEKWPPSERITPLFVSFHLNATVREQMLSPAGIAYLKRHEPIGCRDIDTLNALTGKGIRAYHSGCLTTTLDLKYKSAAPRTDDIYFVDPLTKLPSWDELSASPRSFIRGIRTGDIFKLGPFKEGARKKILGKIFDNTLLQRAIPIPQEYTSAHTEAQRFDVAKSILQRYATARLVVTSRIHCALPCLALGTPVIFLNYGFTEEYEYCRFEGLLDLLNIITITPDGRNFHANFALPASGKIDEGFAIANPARHIQLAEALKQRCADFI